MAQVIDVQPYAIKDPALPHVVQRWPHRVGVVGLCLPVLGEVTDHGVPCRPACNTIVNFVTMPGIKACVQQPHLCLALSRSASLVGGSSSLEDDDLLESFRGLSSLGLFGHRFHWMDWIFSPGSDCGSVSLCSLKT